MGATGSKRKPAAIVMADLAVLLPHDEEGTAAALAACRTVFSEIITAHRERLSWPIYSHI